MEFALYPVAGLCWKASNPSAGLAAASSPYTGEPISTPVKQTSPGNGFKSFSLLTGPQTGEKAVPEGWPHLSVAWFLTHPMAAVRGRVIAEPTLRVVFCIVLRTISQHSCSGKKPHPWSASTASKRWDFSLPFGHKRKDYPERCHYPGSRAAKVQPLSRPVGRQLPLHRGAPGKWPPKTLRCAHKNPFFGIIRHNLGHPLIVPQFSQSFKQSRQFNL